MVDDDLVVRDHVRGYLHSGCVQATRAIEGLAEIIVRTELQPDGAIEYIRARRQQDHRDIVAGIAQFAQRADAVLAGIITSSKIIAGRSACTRRFKSVPSLRTETSAVYKDASPVGLSVLRLIGSVRDDACVVCCVLGPVTFMLRAP